MSAVAAIGRRKGLVDTFGVFLSQLCLAHCFLLPAILAFLPSLDLHQIPGGEILHVVILLLATPTAIYAFLTGKRFHGRNAPLVIGTVGLLTLWLGTALDLGHTHAVAHGVGAFGSFLLICGHIVNRRASKAVESGCGCGAAH